MFRSKPSSPSGRSVLVSLILPAALLLSAGAAGASDRGFYANLKYGSASADKDVGDAFDQVIHGDEDAKTYELGFRFNRYLGVQGAYHDLGNFPGTLSVFCAIDTLCDTTGELRADAKAYSVTGVPQLPLPLGFSVFVKGGVVYWESDVSAVLQDGSTTKLDSLSDTDFIYGAGVRFKVFRGISVFAEWEQIGKDFDCTSLGVNLQF